MGIGENNISVFFDFGFATAAGVVLVTFFFLDFGVTVVAGVVTDSFFFFSFGTTTAAGVVTGDVFFHSFFFLCVLLFWASGLARGGVTVAVGVVTDVTEDECEFKGFFGEDTATLAKLTLTVVTGFEILSILARKASTSSRRMPPNPNKSSCSYSAVGLPSIFFFTEGGGR